MTHVQHDRAAWASEMLAAHVSAFRSSEIPPSATEQARRCVLDLIGASVAGAYTASTRAMRLVAGSVAASGPSSVWFAERKAPPAIAAFVNSGAASALDADDGHRGSGGHPGAAIIPAVLSVAERTEASGAEVLAAIAIGYEIGVRVASARPRASIRTYATGRWAPFGVAAATGWLCGLPEDRLAHALAIAGSQAPDLTAVGYAPPRRTGHMVKEGIPWAVLTGITAVDLAAAGFTGPLALLDEPVDVDRDRLLMRLDVPAPAWAIERTYLKPYACCRWLHAGIDALLAAQDEHGFKATEVRAIRVSTFRRAHDLVNAPAPDSLESAQFSYPFCLAVAAVEGRAGLLPLRAELLSRPEILSLAGRVELEVDPELDALFPRLTPGRVRIETSRATYERRIDYPLGDPENPLDGPGLEAKFRGLTETAWSPAVQQTALDAIFAPAGPSTERLMSILQRPLANVADAARTGRER